jgi:hypothetical protein
MRLTITRRQRSLLFFLSASGYVAAFSGVGARIDAQDITGPRVRSMVFTTAPMPPAVAGQIHRDPFAGAPNVPAPADPGAPSAEPLPTDRGDVGGAVPNIAGAPADLAMNPAGGGTEMTLVVRATIVGKHSVAYVANGSEMDIVRVGDSLGDRRIAAIDLEGIAFTDGSRLDLVASYEATPAPPPVRTNAIDLRIDQLRKLFARTSPGSAAQVAPTQPPIEAPQTEAPVTPAPLRTTDTTGLAPGSNPTPDLSDPTAYPYPYPYPAAHH